MFRVWVFRLVKSPIVSYTHYQVLYIFLCEIKNNLMLYLHKIYLIKADEKRNMHFNIYETKKNTEDKENRKKLANT